MYLIKRSSLKRKAQCNDVPSGLKCIVFLIVKLIVGPCQTRLNKLVTFIVLNLLLYICRFSCWTSPCILNAPNTRFHNVMSSGRIRTITHDLILGIKRKWCYTCTFVLPDPHKSARAQHNYCITYHQLYIYLVKQFPNF